MLVDLSRTLRTRSFFSRRGVTVALLGGLLLAPVAISAAQQAPAPAASQTTTDQQTAPQQAPPATPSDLPAGTTAATPQDNVPTAVLSNQSGKKTRKGSTAEPRQSKKDQKVVATKDTVKQQRDLKRQLKDNPLANVNSTQPDKQLYDRAQVALKKGKYDVSRLLLQDMLATYPDSEYQMRAKLAFADSWYREGGTAALTQAETEYHDFMIFFPNAPEAAEAQMRIGDIYFKQMDKPDRDYTKAVHAQEEYRNMLTQYPDSKLIPDAKQKLREVQEVLASRESNIADFYEGRENYAAAIARYQTVVDTYPLYSKIDSALIGLGDAYAAQAHFVRTSPNMKNLSEDQRARLLRVYEDQATAAYARVVTVYSASNRVEDARDRLEVLGRPVPEPTAEQIAASQALENSRQSYSLANRAKLLVFSRPDTVQAAKLGDPSMADPKATMAPAVSKRIQADFNAAITGKSVPNPADSSTPGSAAGEASAGGNESTAPAAANPPAALSDIPVADAGTSSTGAAAASSFGSTPTGVDPVTAPTGTVGVTILSPNASRTTDAGSGFNAVGPKSEADLPPVEKPAVAPDAVNDVGGVKTPAGQTPPQPGANGKVKNPKPDFDKGEESSSKHKKKGVKKINPF